jgi:hypothetical protein
MDDYESDTRAMQQTRLNSTLRRTDSDGSDTFRTE